MQHQAGRLSRANHEEDGGRPPRTERLTSTLALFEEHVESKRLFANLFLEVAIPLLVGASLEALLQRLNLSKQFYLFGHEVIAPQDRIGEPLVFWRVEVRFEIDGLTFARKIVELPGFNRSSHLLFDELLYRHSSRFRTCSFIATVTEERTMLAAPLHLAPFLEF
jgi:hypothetical protein